jgi:hypothetical protein
VNQNATKGTPENPGDAWKLYLDFEGEENALKRLATQSKDERSGEDVEAESIPQSKLVQEFRAMQSQSLSESQSSSNKSIPLPTHLHEETQTPIPAIMTTTKSPLSTRTVSLPVIDRSAGALWYWFQKRTECTDVPESAADKRVAEELAQHAVKAEEDRVRTKKGLDAIKAKETMMRMARGELERIKAGDQV